MNKIIQIFLIFLSLLFTLSNVKIFAQGIAINSTGSAADESAVLDISSTTQGILVPRMTAAERLAIASPADGLLVFQTDYTAGYYYITSSNWFRIAAEYKDEATGSGSAVTIPGLSISSHSTIADETAILDISSTSKGLLIPRMTNLERVAISSPATGLLVFQTNESAGFYHFAGNHWLKFSSESGFAVLSTSTVTEITGSSASSGGSIIEDGGKTISSKGVCWATTNNPTIANSSTNDGTGSQIFTSSITGLNSNTTYYVRSFATSTEGTAYGNEVSFTTLSITAPVVTTADVFLSGSFMGENVYTLGGEVTSGSDITERGVVCGTSTNPTLDDLKIEMDLGSGTGTFSDDAGGGYILFYTSGTTNAQTIYFRAYAINSVGTSYGPTVSKLISAGSGP